MGGLTQFDVDGLQAAAVLLAERGHASVRAEELARAARMSVGALYRRHGDKEGFVAAVRGFAEEELAAMGSAAWRFSWNPASSRAADFRCAFLTVWHALAGWAVAQPALFSFAFLHHHAPEAEGECTSSGQVRELLHEVLETGLAQGAVRSSSAWLLGGLVWGALLELVRASQTRRAGLDAQELSAAGEAVWCAVRVAPGAAGTRSNAATVAAAVSRTEAMEEACDTAPIPGAVECAEPRASSLAEALGTAEARASLEDTPAARAEALASWAPCCPCATRLRPQAARSSWAAGGAGRAIELERVPVQDAAALEPVPGTNDGADEPPVDPARAAALAFHAAWRWGMWVEPSVIIGHMAALGFDPDCEADVKRAHAEVERGALDFDFVQRWCISGLHAQRDREYARTRQILDSAGSAMSWTEALALARAGGGGATASTDSTAQGPGRPGASPVTSSGCALEATGLEDSDLGTSSRSADALPGFEALDMSTASQDVALASDVDGSNVRASSEGVASASDVEGSSVRTSLEGAASASDVEDPGTSTP